MFRERISDDKIKQIVELLADGYTQQQTADRLGVALSTVSKYSRVGKKPKTVGSPKDYENLRQLISDVIRDELCSLKEEKNNEDKEKKMSEEGIGTRVQEALDRREMLEKLAGIQDLKQKVEKLYDQQKKILDSLREPKENEAIEGLKNEVEKVRKQQDLFCDPKSGQCFVTKQQLGEFLKEQNAKIPQILGGHQDMSSLFRTLAKGKDEELDESVRGRIPPELKARWVETFCKDGECRALLEKDGVHVHDDKEGKKMLGGGYR